MAMDILLFSAIAASLITNIFLAAYIFAKKIRNAAAFYYFLFMVAIVVHVLGDLMFQLSSTIRDALFWILPYWAGFFFLGAFFFLFVTSFPHPRKGFFESNQSKAVILLFPVFMCYLLLFSREFVRYIVISQEGVNYVLYGIIYPLAVGYLAVFMSLGFLVLFVEYRKTSVTSDKRNIELVFIGIFISAFFGLLGDSLFLKLLGFGELKLTSVFILMSALVMSYVVIRHKIFTIIPVSEQSIDTKLQFSAEPGKEYSFDEKNESRRRAFRLFADQVKHNRQGLLISTEYPDQVRKTYNIQRTPIVWLTDSSEAAVGVMKPKDLDALHRSVCLFMEKASNPIVLFEGIKQIVVENGSEKVVEYLNALSAKTRETKATVFFSLRDREVDFISLFNEVNSMKSNLSDLNKKYYSRAISEDAYMELLEDIQSKIIEKEAAFKAIEDYMLGKFADGSALERKRLVLEKSILIINYKIGKRSLGEKIGARLKKDAQKKIVEIDQQLRKKNTVEQY